MKSNVSMALETSNPQPARLVTARLVQARGVVFNPMPKPKTVSLPRAMWEHLQSHDSRVAPPGFES